MTMPKKKIIKIGSLDHELEFSVWAKGVTFCMLFKKDPNYDSLF